MIQGPKFVNASHQKDFDTLGYVKISQFLDETQIHELKQLYQSVSKEHEAIDLPFVSTSHSNSHELIETVNNGIVKIISKSLNDLFVDFEIHFSNFLLKKAILASATDLHEDVTLVDESQFLSFSIWFPLTDVTERNGAMYFIPRSHLFPIYYRTNPYNKSPYRNHHHLLGEFKEVVQCNSGDALVFAHNSIHGSFANLSSEDRISGVLAMYPKGAQTYHYHLIESEKKIECYEMEKKDFIHLDKSKAPQYAKLKESFAWNDKVYSTKEILKFLGQNYWMYQIKSRLWSI